MRLIFAIVIFIFAFSVCFADTPLLDDFIKSKTITAKFKQKNEYHGLDPFYLDGVVTIIRKDTAIWDYKDPVEYYLITSNKLEHYSQELNQLLIVNFSSNDIDDSSSSILSLFLNPEKIKDIFDVNEVSNTVTLKPKGESDLNMIVLTFSKGFINSVYTEDEQGNKISIIFEDIKTNSKINRNVFKKSVPSGTEIIEE